MKIEALKCLEKMFLAKGFLYCNKKDFKVALDSEMLKGHLLLVRLNEPKSSIQYLNEMS